MDETTTSLADPETPGPEVMPVPKYRLGQVVFLAYTKQDQERVKCPDCGDSKKWTVTTLTDSFEVECARCCNYSYTHPSYPVVTPDVRSMTIGSIEVKKYDGGYEVEYMQGRSGGTYFKEGADHVFDTYEEALASAQFKAREKTAELLAKDASAKHKRTISDYRLRDCLAADEQKKARDWKYKYDRALEKITELPDEYIRDVSDEQSKAVARHLLTELDESIPEEWGE